MLEFNIGKIKASKSIFLIIFFIVTSINIVYQIYYIKNEKHRPGQICPVQYLNN